MDSSKPLKVTLCGAGNAVHVMIADFGSHPSEEYSLSVFAPHQDEASRLGRDGGTIHKIANKGHDTTGNFVMASDNPEHVIPDADIIVLSVPSFAHRSILKAIKPYIKKGAILGAIPAQGCFDLTCKSIFGDSLKDIVLFGFNQLPYQCRILQFGKTVNLIGHKDEVALATSPTEKSHEIANLFQKLFGYIEVKPIDHFLNVTLYPVNQIIHPCIMYGLFANDHPEKQYDQPPLFYQGTTQLIGDILTEGSNEVQMIAKAISQKLNVDLSYVPKLDDMMKVMYKSSIEDDSSMASIFATNTGYKGLIAPMTQLDDGKYVPNFNYRYLTEDIPLGLVVIHGLAELADVDTPTIDKIITWAQEKIGKQYLIDGKLTGKDVKETACPQAFGFTNLNDLL